MFINRLSRLTLGLCVAGAVVLSSGCDRGDEGGSGKPGTGDSASGVIKGDKYTIVATLTDQFDRAKAKSNGEDMISAHPDLTAMVGLFAYNPPAILEALRASNRLNKIAVVGFDEQDGTLQAIKDGTCIGTVVQNPYMYGFESVRVLAALARGDQSVIPASKYLDIPPRQIRKDNVDEFWAELKRLRGKGGSDAAAADAGAAPAGPKPRIAYVTNGVDPFWDIAAKGARDAAAKFNADVQVIFPQDGGDQKSKIEDLLVRGVDGIAISPIDAKNQTPSINEWAAKTRIITQDSDAPESNRLMYIGVDNYEAGRMCGLLVKEAVPQGGKVAIFVGRLEQDNARLRRQGVIDELLDRPRPQTNPSNVASAK